MGGTFADLAALLAAIVGHAIADEQRASAAPHTERAYPRLARGCVVATGRR